MIYRYKKMLEKEMATYSILLAGEFHGQRSLAGYSPYRCKDLDMTDQLSTSTYICTMCPDYVREKLNVESVEPKCQSAQTSVTHVLLTV